MERSVLGRNLAHLQAKLANHHSIMLRSLLSRKHDIAQTVEREGELAMFEVVFDYLVLFWDMTKERPGSTS